MLTKEMNTTIARSLASTATCRTLLFRSIHTSSPLAVKNIFVANIPYQYTSTDLGKLFSNHGVVNSAKVVDDRDTGLSRGFGFVEMENDEEASSAISALDGYQINGRSIKVQVSSPRAREFRSQERSVDKEEW